MATKKLSDATNAMNMRSYRPRRPGTTLADVVTPEERAKRASMRQGVKDAAADDAAGAAYDKAMPSPERYAKGGSVGSASKRADGCAVKGKTRGMMV